MDTAQLVESITNTLGRTNRKFNDMSKLQNDQSKIIELAEIIGELSGELAHVRSELLPSKKRSLNPFKK